MKQSDLFDRGWCRFEQDASLHHWVQQALPEARAAVQSPQQAHWLRCGGTWFAGINSLPNAADGSVGGGPPLQGMAVDFIRSQLDPGAFSWDAAQLSVCYAGYPRTMAGESVAAFRYRLHRDAAHVDGLLPEGAERRRHLREHHAFLLGIPMLDCDALAAPFVVWEGSHHIMRETFKQCYQSLAPSDWGELDVTEAYHQARNQVFNSCKRVEISARPGEAYLVHRLALHGMAPWRAASDHAPEGRMICYFRPEMSDIAGWLERP